MIIFVSGTAGTGKTTVAKAISKKYGFNHLSAGELMRKKAKELNLSIVEFQKYLLSHPEIDKEIDNELLAYDNAVIESRVGPFLKQGYSIFLKADINIVAQRVAKRDNISLEEAKKVILKRNKLDRERFLKLYNIDIGDLFMYDLVLDTTFLSKPQMIDIILYAVGKILNPN